MDRDPSHRAFVALDLTGVHARARLEAELARGALDRARALHRAARPVEMREQSVAGGVALDTAIDGELASRLGVVLREQIAPCRVAHLGHALRRTDEVDE